MSANATKADAYLGLSPEDLRGLCAFKDGTIEILQGTLAVTSAANIAMRFELDTAQNSLDHLRVMYDDLKSRKD